MTSGLIASYLKKEKEIIKIDQGILGSLMWAFLLLKLKK